MTDFTPGPAVLGGLLIGLSAALLLLTMGRVAGVSGILAGAVAARPSGRWWRVAFVAGLLAAPLAFRLMGGEIAPISVTDTTAVLVLAGLLVGFGTRLGSGCTSGHGVCGIGRGSRRSIVATATFLITAIATVALAHLLIGA
jgi:uncharacterized membrane protein YedE/YeeE